MQKKIKYIVAFILIAFGIGTPLAILIPFYLGPPSNPYKPPKIPEHNASIYIDGNLMFAAKAKSEGWSGDGTSDTPYVIEDYNISASSVNGIEIRNTDVHFIVQNVSITNGLSNYFMAFYLLNVSNGIFKSNTANNNLAGFFLFNCSKNTFFTNKANNNLHGFRFKYSDNNTVTNNTINNNLGYGVYLENSNYNNVSLNFILFSGLNSTIETNCVGNLFTDNLFTPDAFILKSESGPYDADGTFTLSWTKSASANNYTLYENGAILAEGLILRNYNLTNLYAGTYEFYVKAFNNFGVVLSNTIKVIVKFHIDIDGNLEFHQVAMENNFTGNGTSNNPYIIENYEISAANFNGVYIRNTNIYFIMRDLIVINGKRNHHNGFQFENVSNGKLASNTAYNNQYGFYFSNSFNNTLGSNTASENVNGFRFKSSNFNVVDNNIIINNRHGLLLESSSCNNFIGNNITDNTYLGVYLDISSNNTFNQNIANNNLNGFTLNSSNYNNFTKNTVNNNQQYGFNLISSNYNDLINNDVSNNLKYGIYLVNSNSNKILGNNLENNGLGAIYNNESKNEGYPDVFIVASMIFLIIPLLIIVIKAAPLIKKKVNKKIIERNI